jgi:glutamine cyclotransferase
MSKLQLQRDARATNSVPRYAIALLLFASHACSAQTSMRNDDDAAWRYEIVATHPHDVTSFTQGLAILDGALLESRGRYGESAVSLGAIATGIARKRHALPAEHFGEGIAVAGGKLVQLTWKSGLAFVYDRKLRKIHEHRYAGEGWGLAYDGRDFLMSDGSDRIVRRSARDFTEKGHFTVRDRGRPVRLLNELEFANGRLYANVWYSDQVAVIEPQSGEVEAWIDFSALRRGFARPPGWNESEHVMNGIAHNPANGHFYLTGKCWPVLYEVRLLPPGS